MDTQKHGESQEKKSIGSPNVLGSQGNTRLPQTCSPPFNHKSIYSSPKEPFYPSVSTLKLSVTPGEIPTLFMPSRSTIVKTRHSSPQHLKQKLLQLQSEIRISEEKTAPFYPSTGFKQASYLKTDPDQDALGQNPTLKWCAYCNRQRSTQLCYVNSPKTFWSSVLIFFMGGCLGCFMFPYMTNTCKKMEIVCHTCKKSLN